MVKKMAENGEDWPLQPGAGSWRSTIEELPESEMPEIAKSALAELRAAGGEGRYVKVLSKTRLQVTRAPNKEVFSREFTKICRRILKEDSDFFINPNQMTSRYGGLFAENRNTDEMVAAFEIHVNEIRHGHTLRHEFRHFLDEGRRDESWFSSLIIPPKVQKAIAELMLKRGAISEEDKKVFSYFYHYLVNHGELRAHEEQLKRFFSIRGFKKIPLRQLPRELINVVADFGAISEYSARQAEILAWLNPDDPRIIALTKSAKNFNRLFLLSFGIPIATGTAGELYGLTEISRAFENFNTPSPVPPNSGAETGK
jgi:hypothetical protein